MTNNEYNKKLGGLGSIARGEEIGALIQIYRSGNKYIPWSSPARELQDLESYGLVYSEDNGAKEHTIYGLTGEGIEFIEKYITTENL